MNILSDQYGFHDAVDAMEMFCERGSINICYVSVLAARITGYGINTPAGATPLLAIHYRAFLTCESAS